MSDFGSSMTPWEEWKEIVSQLLAEHQVARSGLYSCSTAHERAYWKRTLEEINARIAAHNRFSRNMGWVKK